MAPALNGILMGMLLATLSAAAQSGDVRGVHDPSIIQQGATWYVFSTGAVPGMPPGPHGRAQIPIRCSIDLKTWKLCSYVFDHIPDWIQQRVTGGVHDLWAPDISFEDGEYRLYYAYSIFGTNSSGIALAVNKTLDPASKTYVWVDKGPVLESKKGDDFNAIDPNFIRDEHGQDWLAFGSFWSGIKLVRLAADGKVDEKHHKLLALARRAGNVHPGAVEAPFILRHGAFYYLFTSWGICCQGAKSTYSTVVGRSKSITGPYLDESGKKLLEGGGTTILEGNPHWAGPGGESVWIAPHGQDVMVFHAYDRTTGTPVLQVVPIQWENDWPKIPMPD